MRRPLRNLLVAALALTGSLALAGCFGDSEPTVGIAPYVQENVGGAGRLTQYALYVTNSGAYREDVTASPVNVPEGWNVTLSNASLSLRGGGAGRPLVVNVVPPTNASLGRYTFGVQVGDRTVSLGLRLVALPEEEARPRVGALVRTTGFYDNGTIFYHDMVEVMGRTDLRKGILGNDTDVEPLKVYVGGQRRIPPPEPYANAGYVPVIPGFDEALHGLRPGETRVVHVPPDLAYTYPGNEKHRLYGQALNFLIVLERVDEIPDETTTGSCPLPVCPTG
ncbi:MAG TPA: FKBP-type peptidyl-prolyl cis-trans isomerase [Candidatus Thermoplasmatota archaeon]|nr:FKBP-type peptidyl-prolyl cis-trans isomerase [Candidatus Thermoplasmatota archaeon]